VSGIAKAASVARPNQAGGAADAAQAIMRHAAAKSKNSKPAAAVAAKGKMSPRAAAGVRAQLKQAFVSDAAAQERALAMFAEAQRMLLAAAQLHNAALVS
jgi:hypothetical protein